ncbi:carbohydrate esterase family 4 protein, partial [Gonapodya prolifera JEL478]
SCVEPGMVALTFDDGPFRYTPALLDLLDQLGVRATFFVNGNNQGNINDPVYSSMVQRAHSSGHCIGSHTWSHPNLLTLPDDQVRSQLTQVDEALQRILGVRPNFVRPPYVSAINCI